MGNQATKENKAAIQRSSATLSREQDSLLQNQNSLANDLYATGGYGSQVKQAMYGYQNGLSLQTHAANTPKLASSSHQVGQFSQKASSTTHALSSANALQRKLTIGSPEDSYEKEADQMAEKVMHMPDNTLQRMCATCESSGSAFPKGVQKEKVQMKSLAAQITPLIQRQSLEEDENEVIKIQAKANRSISSVPSSFQNQLSATKGGGMPLPEHTNQSMSQAFGSDFSGVRIHTDTGAQGMNQTIQAKAFTHGADIYFDQGQYQPDRASGKTLLAHELTHVVQQTGMKGPVIQRQEKNKTDAVPYQVHITQEMTGEQFAKVADQQIFGGVIPGKWINLKASYKPEESPIKVNIDIRLLKKHRGQVSKERGISVGEGGGITGAEERAQTFHAGVESDVKSALINEIDERYFKAVGERTKINAGEKGKAELWRTIRDEVLFQHEYIANLPPQVKELIKFSTKGKDLTPADYDKLFAIAKKIEKMPVGQASDYASKVTGTTTDLTVFESSLDKYMAERTLRDLQGAERDKIKTKLIGLEEIYNKYKLWKTLSTTSTMSAIGSRYPGGGGGGGIVAAREAEKMRQELETQLQAHGFKGIDDFKVFIESYERAFEKESANIAKDLLDKYAGKLYKESERYKNPSEIATLHQKLGGFRTQFQEFEPNAKIWNDYKRDSERARLPGQGHLQPKTTSTEAETARKKAEAAKAVAVSQFEGLSGDHPIFQEAGLSLDKRIDKSALAKASESELGALLQSYIQNRMQAIGEAKTEIDGKPELIYKMEKLFPQFYAQQGIKSGSIHDMIIQDKMKSDAIIKLAKGIGVAIIAIALSVVTFGAATPVIVAAGAGILGAGLGIYQAYESYQEYTQEKSLADVGFAKDPSVIWLVIAIAGAALDMGSAVSAVSKLGKAAKVLDAGGDLATFNKTVRQLEEANEITAKIARAAENAAAARKGFAEASTELGKAMGGKMYSFPGPLADYDVYKAVVKLARQAIKTKVYDAQKFIEEIKLARVNAKLGDLTPEELVKAKQAWEEAKLLEVAEQARYQKLLLQIPDAVKLDALIAKAGDIEKLERLLKAFPVTELEAIFTKLKDPAQLINILDHAGAETGAGMIREWMKNSGNPKAIAKMNQFLENLAAGGKELAETSAVGAKSLIIDSNTAIALMMDADPALRASMHDGHRARVAFIKSQPPGTELRIGNVTVGEIQGGVLSLKGVPVEAARESAEYQKVLGALAREKVGAGKGFADRGLIADVFFAKTNPGVVPRFLTADQNAVKKLAGLAGIEVEKIGGYPGILKNYGKSGFNVTLEGRTITVIPIE